MKELAISTETFIREISETPRTKTEIQNYNMISVKLKFSPQVAFRVYDEFTDSVTADCENNLYVTTNLPDNETMYSYLLTFGEYVEVLAPNMCV